MIDRLRETVDEATIPVVRGRYGYRIRARHVRSGVPGVQHNLQPAHSVRAGACFRNAARHLSPGGRFVVELWVPELRSLPPGRQATVWQVEPGYIGLDPYVSTYRLADS